MSHVQKMAVAVCHAVRSVFASAVAVAVCLTVLLLPGSAFAQTSTVPELVDATSFTTFVTDMIAMLGPILVVVIGAALGVKGLRILVRWLMGAFSK